MLKKTLSFVLLAVLFGFSTQIFAQDKKDDGFKVVKNENVKETDVNRQMNLARSLVEYGYENNSAISLVQAAEIFSKHPVKQLELIGEDGKPVETVAPAHSYEPKDLLSDAKFMAKKDAELLAYIEKAEKGITKQTRAEAAAGGLSATVKLGGGQSKTITLDAKPLSYNRVHAKTNDYSDLSLSVWTVWEDKGSDSGTRPSVSFFLGASSRISVGIRNLESSSTSVEIFLECIGVEDFE